MGFSGQGWAHNSTTNRPPFFTPGNDSLSAWNKRWSGSVITFPTSMLNFIVKLGTNDTSDAAVTAAVTGYLTAQRAVLPTTRLIVLIPPDNAHSAAITTGFNNYVTASGDANVYLRGCSCAGTYATSDGGTQ
jgi:hypothetical protein